MRIGVTGAAGHIGGTICRLLVEKGYEVNALVHSDTESIKDLPIHTFKGNILNKDSLYDFMKNCDVIIHTAGYIELDYRFSQNVFDINVTGTKNVIEVAKTLDIKKMIHFSSIHIFNHQPHQEPLDEKRELVGDKAIFYDRAKKQAHEIVLEAVEDGLDISIVCPTAVVGPYDFKPSKLGKAITDIYKGKIPAMVKGGFDFVDVRDVAEGTIAAIENGRKGETYILGGQYHTIKSFSDLVLQAKGSTKQMIVFPIFFAYLGLPFIQIFSWMTKKPPLYDAIYLDILQDGNPSISHAKATEELNYQPRSLKESINDSVQWFLQQKMI